MTTRTTTKTGTRGSAAGKTTSKTATTRKAPARTTTTTRGAASKPASRSTGKTAAPRGTNKEIDSPILPVEQLDALRKIKPGAVDWIIEQTQLEAEHRRAEETRVNNLIFVEHLFAQAAALIVGVAGIGGGVWLVKQGQLWPGVAIAAVVMVALAVVQLSAKKSRR